MPASPSPLSRLLEDPPEGVAVARRLDAVEIRLRRAPWLIRSGAWLPAERPEGGARSEGRSLAVIALGIVILALLVQRDLSLQAEPEQSLLAAAGALGVLGALAAGALLVSLADRAWLRLRPCRVILTPHRLIVEDGRRSCEIELESVAWSVPEPAAGSPRAPGELAIGLQDRRYQLLRGVSAGHVRWLSAAVTAAASQRRSALLAAGHDLSRPPPEAEALQAVAAEASGRPRSGL